LRQLVTGHRALLATSLVAAGILLVGQLEDGWWHHDDGSFGQSAVRVLHGELPHRDFADLYTGLLTFINAGVFAVFGEDLFNLRLPVVALFLAYVGCFFALAQRFVSPPMAFAATLFAITWTLPVYPAPMPSWYQLFLATIGMYAIVRFFESDGRHWLALAGLCGGVSLAIKVTGVWYVAAVVLALLLRPLLEQEGREAKPHRAGKGWVLVIVAALSTLTLLMAVFSGYPVPAQVASLFVPAAGLCVVAAAVGWKRRGDAPHYSGLDAVGLFLAAAAVPLALLAIPYIATGSLRELVDGVLIAPRSRYEFSSYEGPASSTLLRALPVLALLLLRWRLPTRWRLPMDVAAAALIVVLVATASQPLSYSILWGSVRALAPWLLVLGAIVLLRWSTRPDTHHLSPQVALTLLVAGFMTLVQFPFAAPVYFCYAVSLVLLAGLATARLAGLSLGPLAAVALAGLVIFGARQLDRQTLLSLGNDFAVEPRVQLDNRRASISVHPSVKAEYDQLRALVGRHVGPNETLFAGPDAPEIYYLTGKPNRTRALIDFLDASGSTRGERLMSFLVREKIPLVVINHHPQQSPQLTKATIERMRSTYGSSTRVGQFEVRWR
jgi:hypothetical protein